MADFKDKRIIIGVPTHFGIDKMIEKELQALGLITVNISVFKDKLQYKKFFQRIENFFCEVLLRKKNYRYILNFKANRRWVNAKLSAIDRVDYILIIRPDAYPIRFLKALKKKGMKMVAYQWDGLQRFPNSYQYIPLFDRFFVFDGRDLALSDVLPATNFYPLATGERTIDRHLQSDVFYVGNYSAERIHTLTTIVNQCKNIGCHVHCHLYSRRKRTIMDSELTTTDISLDYQENLKFVYNTTTVLDLVDPSHEGLSFRILEAVGLAKKVITTNKKVKEYDFYHANNIFVWDNSTTDELAAFFQKPYHTLPSTVIQKYGFKNWISYLLDNGEYTPLTIPR